MLSCNVLDLYEYCVITLTIVVLAYIISYNLIHWTNYSFHLAPIHSTWKVDSNQFP